MHRPFPPSQRSKIEATTTPLSPFVRRSPSPARVPPARRRAVRNSDRQRFLHLPLSQPSLCGGWKMQAAEGVPVNDVVECVVRNAMETLWQKHQTDVRTPSVRKLQIAKAIEETRMQFVSLLALVRWHKNRHAVTSRCEDLIESLQVHQWHLTSVSERLSISAEELAHTHRAPMFDVRTAVDVMATGTYNMMPTLNLHHRAGLPPRISGGEDEQEVERHQDFLIRSKLLSTKVPNVCSHVNISGGRVTLSVESNFELTLSLKLEAPGRPWRVHSIKILVKAEGYEQPTTDILATRLESRMAAVEQPLVEAFNILSDFCRLRTWQILNQQVYNSISGPRLLIETTPTGNTFTIHYWPDSHVLSFECLAWDYKAPVKDADDKKGGGGALLEEYKAKLPPPHLTLTMHNQTMTTVEIKHRPPLFGADGRPLDISLNRDNLDLAVLVQGVIAEHAKCRLRVLRHAIESRAHLLEGTGVSVSMSPGCDELSVFVDSVLRLSITVDTRTGDLCIRDIATLSPSSTDEGLSALTDAVSSGVDNAAQALVNWRTYDMLELVRELAPLCGVQPVGKLLVYSRVQSLQLAKVIGKEPAMCLHLPGCNILDSGFQGMSASVPKPMLQPIYVLIVRCDAKSRQYRYTLAVLSVDKTADARVEELCVPGAGSDALPAAKRRRGGGGGVKDVGGGREEADAAQHLTLAVHEGVRRVSLMKLKAQLESQKVKCREVEGTLLLRMPCDPLVTREFRVELSPEDVGCRWSVEILLITRVLEGKYKDVKELGEADRHAMGGGCLEDFVQVLDGKQGERLLMRLPHVHADSVREFGEVLDGVVGMTNVGKEAERLLGQGEGASKMLQAHLGIEYIGYTGVVLRVKSSGALLTIRYLVHTGFRVTCQGYPFTSQVEKCLNGGELPDVKKALSSIVITMPLLDAMRKLPCCEGDYVFLPYATEGFGAVFRGTFGLHIRVKLQEGHDDASSIVYSISDMCPHPGQRSLPPSIDSGFMTHASHTVAPMSAFVDTLWAIPNWHMHVISMCNTANTTAHGIDKDEIAAVKEAGESALKHVTMHRAAAVCSGSQVELALMASHRHIAASHLRIVGNHCMKERMKHMLQPAAGAAAGGEKKFTRGSHVITLQVMSPAAMPQREDRLILSFEPSVTAQQPALLDEHTQRLNQLFMSSVSAPPFAGNRLRSFIHLVSLPVPAIVAFCDLLKDIGPADTCELALAPAYVIASIESSSPKPGADPTASKAGAVGVAPRSDGASSIRHREPEEKVGFIVRMWVSARCPVDVCLDYAYNKKQLQVTELRSLGKGAGGHKYIASVSGKSRAPIDVSGGLWAGIKILLPAAQ